MIADVSERRRRLGWLLRGALACAGVVFIAIALRRSFAGDWRDLVPTWPRVMIALVLIVAGLLSAGLSWRTLFGPAGRARGLTKGFFFATLARYVPGGIWQPVGQVGSATGSGIPMRTALVAFPVHTVIYIVSGAVVGAGVALFVPGLTFLVRSASAGGVLAVVLLDRRVMATALQIARRFVRRLPTPDEIPGQGAILRAFVLTTVTVVLTCASFAVLAKGGIGTVCAFAAAWTVGFILLPIPSGIGVREAILVGLLPVPTRVLLTAAIAHRVAMMIGELAVAGTAAADSVYRRGREVAPVSSDPP
jgi:glycosyltransferase 2 family protein